MMRALFFFTASVGTLFLQGCGNKTLGSYSCANGCGVKVYCADGKTDTRSSGCKEKTMELHDPNDGNKRASCDVYNNGKNLDDGKIKTSVCCVAEGGQSCPGALGSSSLWASVIGDDSNLKVETSQSETIV